jgi:hypothetical protein
MGVAQLCSTRLNYSHCAVGAFKSMCLCSTKIQEEDDDDDGDGDDGDDDAQ